MPRKKLGEMLIEAGVLTEQALRMALGEQRRWGGTLGKTLVELKIIREPELVRVLSMQLGLQAVEVDTLDIHPTVLELVTGEFAEQHSLIPFAQPMKFLDVAMAEPTNQGVVDELRIRTQLNIRPYLTGPKMIERALAKFYRRGFGRVLARRDSEIPIEGEDTIPLEGSHRTRAGTAEIDAARKREGLRPAMKPTRPPPVEIGSVPTAPGLGSIGDIGIGGPPPLATRDAEIDALQDRISKLEALVERDEEVLRKLLALLVEKGVATREEILERIR